MGRNHRVVFVSEKLGWDGQDSKPQSNKQKRLEFALTCIENDEDYWLNILWTDETTVRQLLPNQNKFAIVHSSLDILERPKKISLQLSSTRTLLRIFTCT